MPAWHVYEVAAVFNIFDKKHHVGGYVHSLQSLLVQELHLSVMERVTFLFHQYYLEVISKIYLVILADWWSIYGGSCPNLARLAIRILSQTCSAIGCSHNHIPFEKVYRTRNCLQRQRLTDLVFVQYNLRLRQM